VPQLPQALVLEQQQVLPVRLPQVAVDCLVSEFQQRWPSSLQVLGL
jgi:hypothetical protein